LTGNQSSHDHAKKWEKFTDHGWSAILCEGLRNGHTNRWNVISLSYTVCLTMKAARGRQIRAP
jgi:hypothetical protein